MDNVAFNVIYSNIISHSWNDDSSPVSLTSSCFTYNWVSDHDSNICFRKWDLRGFRLYLQNYGQNLRLQISIHQWLVSELLEIECSRLHIMNNVTLYFKFKWIWLLSPHVLWSLLTFVNAWAVIGRSSCQSKMRG